MSFRFRRINKRLGLILSAVLVAAAGLATTGAALAGTARPDQGSCNGTAQPPNPSGHLESLLANLTPAPGSKVKPGTTVQFLYTDETPMASSASGIPSPSVTIDGTQVSPAPTVTATSGVTPTYLNPQNGGSEGTQCQDLITFTVPKNLKAGSHTIVLTVYDGDGDHDTYSFTYTTTAPPKPSISILKQVCTVAAAKCSGSNNSDWASSHEIPSGSTAVWRITVTNTGKTTLTNVTVSDPNAPTCSSTIGTLAAGAANVYTCDSTHVTSTIVNTATVSGKSSTGVTGTSSSTATVTVTTKPPPGITSSQSLTPNDLGDVVNGEGATGHMTFDLYPPSDPSCTGSPVFTQTVAVSDGAAETTNTSFVATTPGKWRWLITYSGSPGHKAATSPCGSESFTLTN